VSSFTQYIFESQLNNRISLQLASLWLKMTATLAMRTRHSAVQLMRMRASSSSSSNSSIMKKTTLPPVPVPVLASYRMFSSTLISARNSSGSIIKRTTEPTVLRCTCARCQRGLPHLPTSTTTGITQHHNTSYFSTTSTQQQVVSPVAAVQQLAPDFTATAVTPECQFSRISLSDYRGKYVVLFFYPLGMCY